MYSVKPPRHAAFAAHPPCPGTRVLTLKIDASHIRPRRTPSSKGIDGDRAYQLSDTGRTDTGRIRLCRVSTETCPSRADFWSPRISGEVVVRGVEGDVDCVPGREAIIVAGTPCGGDAQSNCLCS